MADLLILNGTVVSPVGLEALDVVVTGETITALGPRGTLGGLGRSGIRRRAVAGIYGRIPRREWL